MTFIAAEPEDVWDALTSAELTADYWGHSNVSDWVPGSRWKHVRTDGSGTADVVGRVVEADGPGRLAITFGDPNDSEAPQSLVTFRIQPGHGIVKVTITHDGLPGDQEYALAASGWSSVASNLKSLLETGKVLPQAPWELDTELRAKR